MHTRARGGGARINKRTAHIKITLDRSRTGRRKADASPRAQEEDQARLLEADVQGRRQEGRMNDTAAPRHRAKHAPVAQEAATKASIHSPPATHPEQVTAGEKLNIS